jgi:DNA-binding beta-propeller fold protein YncE
VIDPASRSIIGSAPVEAVPEYIRFVPATNELWVTEPEIEQIEVFSTPTEDPFTPVQTSVIPVPKGPTGLIIDRSRGLAYTNQPEISMTMVIQVQTRGILDQWGNGCSEARGLALDEERGYLFVACGEGKVVMMDSANDGLQIASHTYGGDIKAIAYNPRLQHVYLPSGASAILAIFGITRASSASGTATPSGDSSGEAPAAEPGSANPGESLALVRLGTVDTALNATCVTIDDQDGIWVCDPAGGQLLVARDTFPASDAGS